MRSSSPQTLIDARACRPSSIPAVAAQRPPARPLALNECPGLLERLAAIPDPRDRRGLQHPLTGVLGVSAAAVLAGARSATAIQEWAADAPQPVLAALGARRDALTGLRHIPHEATIRRALARVDADALDAAVGAWLADRLRPPGPRRRRAIAVDGKTLRGTARGERDRPVHLLAALDHSDVRCSPNTTWTPPPARSRCSSRRWAGLDLAGVVVTADAMHTQRDHASFLVDRGADYLLIVKANQPALHRQLLGLPWHKIPVMDRTRDHAHGRVELRTLKVATVAGLELPHAAQAIQLTRRVRAPGNRSWRTVVV